MENLPAYIGIVFGMITLLTVYFLYKAAGQSKLLLVVLLLWLLLQAIIAATGFYTNTHTTPPRFMIVLLPPLIMIGYLFLTGTGKRFIDSLDIQWLTILHSVRVVVEFVLFWLFTYKVVPVVMTFEGWNFDIVSGITAPVVYYFVFIRKSWDKRILLAWNACCIFLLVNIVLIAVLSAPFNFQQLAFDQPNIAVMYFPFIWLPCCVVPIVLFSHLAVIRQIAIGKASGNLSISKQAAIPDL